MLNLHKTRLQSAFRDFAQIGHWRSPHAVTLTMRQGIRPEPFSPTEYLDRQRAVQNFRHFMNLLNRRVLGSHYQRKRQRLPVIPVLEGSGRYRRLHYHAVIDCPRDDLDGVFPLLIQSVWAKTKWAFVQTDVRPDADEGWVNYISKTYDKPDYADAIDWENCHQLDSRV
jgi:hypothetical protein